MAKIHIKVKLRTSSVCSCPQVHGQLTQSNTRHSPWWGYLSGVPGSIVTRVRKNAPLNADNLPKRTSKTQSTRTQESETRCKRATRKIMQHKSRFRVMAGLILPKIIRSCWYMDKCLGPTFGCSAEIDVYINLCCHLCEKEDGHEPKDLVGTVIKNIES